MQGWKTIIFGGLIALLGFLQSVDFTTVVTTANAGYITAGIGVAIMVLRTLTSTPVGKST